MRWNRQETEAFGRQPLRAAHRLQESPLLAMPAIVELIDRYPRERMQAFTMGTDLMCRDDWMPIAVGDLSANDILAAVRRGRIWFKLLNLQVVDRKFATLLDELYADLAAQCQGFHPVRTYATLLISSPSAMVYYHADPQPNLLWQLYGRKTVYVYPAGDRELISLDLMEDIFASWVDEEAPYERRFEQKVVALELPPGQVASWPQNSPHRVSNVEGINISLSTLHETEESDRRKLVYCANRLLRRSYGLPVRSIRETGAWSYGKRAAYRAARRFGLVETPPTRAYVTELVLDPSSDMGYSTTGNGPALTEFSSKQFTLKRDASGGLVPVRKS